MAWSCYFFVKSVLFMSPNSFFYEVTDCDTSVPSGIPLSRFTGSFVQLCVIQILVSFKASNEVWAIRAEGKFCGYSSNVFADSFRRGLLLTHVDVISLRKQLDNCIFMSSLFCRIEFCRNLILPVGILIALGDMWQIKVNSIKFVCKTIGGP